MLKNKNILILSPDLNKVCGRSKYVKLLSEILIYEKWNVYLVTNKGEILEDLKTIGVVIIDADIAFQNYNPIVIYRSLAKLITIIKTHKIDIYHSQHRYYEILGFLLKKMFFLKSLKLVTTVHSIHERNYSLFKHPSERIIAISSFIRNHLVENIKIKSKRVVTIHNYVAINNIPRVYNHNLGKCIKILSAGRFSFEKGFDIALKALSMSTKINYIYYILGEGQEINNLIAFANTNRINVKFISAKANISKFYLDCDVCIIPSRSEGLSYVALEAGSFGMPVIASNVGGLNDILVNNKTGFLFENQNSVSLLEKILYTIENPEIAEVMGKNLREKVAIEFNSVLYSKKMFELYKSLFN